MTTKLEEFSRSGLTFDVTDSGVGDSGGQGGETVVLLHGFPTDRHSWEPISQRLTAQGLRTLAPDQRGYSPRARPTEPYPQAYALPELVADVVALLDAAQLERAHLVGHDWGGGVAWAVAGAYPERIASLTALSTPHPGAMMSALRSPWQAVHSSYMALFQVRRLPERYLRDRIASSLQSSGLPRDAAERYAGRMREPGALTAALGWYRALTLSRGTVHRCRVPTTYVWGRRDPFLGRRAAEATGGAVLADYRFVEADEGHWLPELQPQLCADEIAARVTAVV